MAEKKSLSELAVAKRKELAEKGLTLTKAKKSEALALLNTGASIAQTSALLSLTPSQVERIDAQRKRDAQAKALAESAQIRTTRVGADAEAVAKRAQAGEAAAVDRLLALIAAERDLSKVAQAVKVLHQIAEGAQERTELTQTVSRLRGE